MITEFDLIKHNYDEKILEKYIDTLNIKVTCQTQKLSEEFCAKYVFCSDIESGSEDSYLFDINYIMRKQPHLDKEKLIKLIHKYHP